MRDVGRSVASSRRSERLVEAQARVNNDRALRDGLVRLFDRNAKIEAAARKVVEAVGSDEVTPKAWAFDTPAPIREAIIELEDVLDDR